MFLAAVLLSLSGCKKDELAPPELAVDKTEIKLTGLVNNTDSLVITGNTDWTITVNPAADWLQVDQLSGSGSATIHLKNTKENGTEPVEVTLTINPTEAQVPALTVKVVQSPYFNMLFSRLEHENNFDSFRSGVATADGGFIMAGLTMKEEATGVDWMQNGLIAKYSATGQLIWKKILGGTNYDVLKRVIATTDGNYIAIGDTRIPEPDDAAAGLDYWVVKFDPNGNVIWNKTYGASLVDLLMCAGALPNGGILLAGTSRISDGTTGGPVIQLQVLQLDAQGAVQNSKLITDPNKYYNVQGMVSTKDGNFMLSGYRGNPGSDSLSREAYLMKLSPAATVLWEKTYAGYYSDDNGALVATEDGGYCFGNRLLSQDKLHYDAHLIKTDANGNKTWEKSMGGSGHEDAGGLAEIPGGGYFWVINASPTSNTVAGYHNGLDVLLVKLDALGNKIWSKTFGGSKYDNVYDILRTTDNRFVISGAVESNDGFFSGVQGQRDAWIMKFE